MTSTLGTTPKGAALSYWFAYRVFDRNIDINPGAEILEGPFESYELAKSEKIKIRGSDMQKTSIFPAASKNDAEIHLPNETWMV